MRTAFPRLLATLGLIAAFGLLAGCATTGSSGSMAHDNSQGKPEYWIEHRD